MKVGANPTWRFKADPNYNWVDLGEEIIYLDTPVEGSSHVDGQSTNTGPPSRWNALVDDLYNRVGFVKQQADTAANKGWLKNVTINASRALTVADIGLINVYTADRNSPQVDAVELTLPTRAEMVAAGFGYLLRTTSSPFMTPVGRTVPIFAIKGYSNSSQVPMKITVAQPADVAPGADVDAQQYINVAGFNAGQSMWLYNGEYAELAFDMFKDDVTGTWYLGWNVFVHKSGYDNLGRYFQMPVNSLPQNGIRCNNGSVSRAQYPRLWEALSRVAGGLSGSLVNQGSKTNDKYGNGNGTTTFTMPNLAALEAGLVTLYAYY